MCYIDGQKNKYSLSRQLAHRLAVRLLDLNTDYAVLPKTLFVSFSYSFLLEAEQTPGPSVAGRIN
jgi:hypothetical protein